MMKRSNQIFLSTSMTLLTFVTAVSGQSGKSTTNNAPKKIDVVVQSTPPEREQDGFNGPVMHVKSEIVRLKNIGGKFTESAKVVFEEYDYDEKGARKAYSLNSKALDSGATTDETYKYEYKSDDKGNVIEMTVLKPDGSFVKKESYSYEYDPFDNWKKMTTSVAVFEEGKIKYVPSEITYRNITYPLSKVVEDKFKEFEARKNAPVEITPSPTPSPIAVAAVQLPTNTGTMLATKTPLLKVEEIVKPPVTDTSKTGTQTVPVQNTTATNTANKAATPVTTNDAKTQDIKSTQTATQANGNSTTDPSVSANHSVTAQPKPIRRLNNIPISKGVLNGQAMELPSPDYPEFAKRMRVQGLIKVEVVIDEKGKVISATPIEGPEMLRSAAKQAALRARFTPTTLSDQAVKVTGIINYSFALK